MDHCTGLEGVGSRVLDFLDRTLSAERLKPGTVVELGIVLDELAVITNKELVDANDRVSGGLDDPSPGDRVAGEPNVQCLNLDLGLENSLAVVEGSFAGEGDGAELREKESLVNRDRPTSSFFTYREASHEVDRVGNINKVVIQGGSRNISLVTTSGRDEATVGGDVVGELKEDLEVVHKLASGGLVGHVALARGSSGGGDGNGGGGGGNHRFAGCGGSSDRDGLSLGDDGTTTTADSLGHGGCRRACGARDDDAVSGLDVNRLGGGGRGDGGGLDDGVAKDGAGTGVVNLVAGAGVVGNQVGAHGDRDTSLPSILAALGGDGHGLGDGGRGHRGGEEALAVRGTNAGVSKSSFASDGGQAGIFDGRSAWCGEDAADHGSQRQDDGKVLHDGIVLISGLNEWLRSTTLKRDRELETNG